MARSHRQTDGKRNKKARETHRRLQITQKYCFLTECASPSEILRDFRAKWDM